MTLPQEYEELTEKLNQLQIQEQDLRDRRSNGRASPSPVSTPVPELDLPPPHIQTPEMGGTLEVQQVTTPPRPPPLTLPSSGKGASAAATPALPVRAYLPNQQRTSVSWFIQIVTWRYQILNSIIEMLKKKN